MLENSVRRMKIEELEDVFNHIKKDFVPGEYAPYGVLLHQLQRGIQEGLIFTKGEHDTAYSICTGGHANGYVLISLFAVYEEYRNQGIGSAFIKELSRVYSDKKGIIVEVEKPEESSNKEERIIREKRIKFYEKAGFYLIPDIDYSIWGVPMHLMVKLHSAEIKEINEGIGRIMYETYLELMGKQYIDKMKFKYINK